MAGLQQQQPQKHPSWSCTSGISMYREPPPGEVCIEEFERYAIDRLRGEHERACLVHAGSPICCAAQPYIKMRRECDSLSLRHHGC